MKTRRILLTATWVLLVFSAGSAQAVVSSLNNGVIEIGIDTSKGGAITYLASTTGNTNNLVNSRDPGREVQESYYYCGVNPVRAGDENGNWSSVLDWNNTGSELYVKTQPLDWSSDNVPVNCYMEQWIALSGNVATVDCRLTNFTPGSWTIPDYTDWQELPAVYTVGTLSRLWTYNGTQPFTGGALTEITGDDYPSAAEWRATENWAAHVNNSNFGVGVFKAGHASFSSFFYGTRGQGGPTSDSCGYLSPFRKEIIDPTIVYDYSYKLIVGNLTQIRSCVYANQPDNRPDYRFNGTRAGWWYEDGSGLSDSGVPTGDHLHVQLTGLSTSAMQSPTCAFQGSDVPTLYVCAAYSSGCTGYAQFNWEIDNGDQSAYPTWVAGQVYGFAPIFDGQYHVYSVNVGERPSWSDHFISALDFYPLIGNANGGYMDIKWISYQVPEPGTMVLLLTGLSGLVAFVLSKRRKRRSRSHSPLSALHSPLSAWPLAGLCVVKVWLLAMTSPAWASVTLNAGPMSITLKPEYNWTVSNMTWNSYPMMTETGYNGTVFWVQNDTDGDGVPDDEGAWAGTGHGNETVISTSLWVDGVSRAVVDGSAYSGQTIKFVRTTNVGGAYRLTSTMTVRGTGTDEQVVLQGLDSHKLVGGDEFESYGFLGTRCQLTNYASFNAKGQLLASGVTDKNDDSFVYLQPAVAVAQYNPTAQKGVVSEVTVGTDLGLEPFIWDRGDNKLYNRFTSLSGPASTDKQFTFRQTVIPFEAAPEVWMTTAGALVTPEPDAMVLLWTGLVGVLAWVWRKRG